MRVGPPGNDFRRTPKRVDVIQWKCTECKGTDFDEDWGDLTCKGCGLVAAEGIAQMGEDKRVFESDDVDHRQNEVQDKYSAAIGTAATSIGLDDNSEQAQRLRKMQNQTNPIDESMKKCSDCIQRVIEKCPRLKRTTETARDYCKVVLDKSGKKSTNIDVCKKYAAAAVALTNKYEFGLAVTNEEIAVALELPSRTVHQAEESMRQQLSGWGYREKLQEEVDPTNDWFQRYLDVTGVTFGMNQILMAGRKKIPSNTQSSRHTVASTIFIQVIQGFKLKKKGPNKEFTLNDLLEVTMLTNTTYNTCVREIGRQLKEFIVEITAKLQAKQRQKQQQQQQQQQQLAQQGR